MGSIKKLLPSLIFLFTFANLYAQNNSGAFLPLSSEISRLEKSSLTSAPLDSYNSFITLARLYRLSGNSEAALKSYEGALELFPDDGRSLFEQGQLLISLGEYEKAAGLVFRMMGKNLEKEFYLKARYLFALLEAYRSGNHSEMALLAEDHDFYEYRSVIYYTLWQLSKHASWLSRLKAEFPKGPEARIAEDFLVLSPTPHWLLFPGRENVALTSSVKPTAAAAAQSPPVASTPVAASTPAALQTSTPASQVNSQANSQTNSQGTLLQTGLFSNSTNAQVFADRLKKAGFAGEIIRRQVNGADRWAVTVLAGSDTNAMIKRLKDAGFDSFPIR